MAQPLTLLPSLLLLATPSSSITTAATTTYYVSQLHGTDSNSGSTQATSFKTLARCAAAMATSSWTGPSTCKVERGTYRESVLLNDKTSPIHSIGFEGVGDEDAVVVSGLDPLPVVAPPASWKIAPTRPACTYVTAVQAGSRFQQLFFRGAMMVEARWPNLDVDSLHGASRLSDGNCVLERLVRLNPASFAAVEASTRVIE
jgi:hypothetical protein